MAPREHKSSLAKRSKRKCAIWQPHYTPFELAARWKIPEELILKLLKKEVSVLRVGDAVSVPESVAEHLYYNLLTNETALALKPKPMSRKYDVFLCHNSEDKGIVKRIGYHLKRHGIRPWLDEWELRPGLSWQAILEQSIEDIGAAAVFIGRNGIGPWQRVEVDAFLRQFVLRECPVIPVVLPDALGQPKLPPFLAAMTWVDMRTMSPDPVERLIWGITGNRRDSPV